MEELLSLSIFSNKMLVFRAEIHKMLVRIAEGAQLLSGRVLDSRLWGHGFKTYRHYCVMSLSKTFIVA